MFAQESITYRQSFPHNFDHFLIARARAAGQRPDLGRCARVPWFSRPGVGQRSIVFIIVVMVVTDNMGLGLTAY